MSVQPNNTLGMGRAINSETLRQTKKERKAGGGRGSKRKQLEGIKRKFLLFTTFILPHLSWGAKIVAVCQCVYGRLRAKGWQFKSFFFIHMMKKIRASVLKLVIL